MTIVQAAKASVTSSDRIGSHHAASPASRRCGIEIAETTGR